MTKGEIGREGKAAGNGGTREPERVAGFAPRLRAPTKEINEPISTQNWRDQPSRRDPGSMATITPKGAGRVKTVTQTRERKLKAGMGEVQRETGFGK